MSFFQTIRSRILGTLTRKTPAGVKSTRSVRPVTSRELLIHLGIMMGILLVLALGFFFIYLPSTTNHNDLVQVPKITGMKLEEIEDLLDEHDLRYEVQDSDYVSKYPPLTVIEQYPEAGAEVKEDRKIFITVVAQNPPTVEMPDLKDFSLRSAQETLESFELQLGQVLYKPDSLHANAVLAQQVNGKAIEPGTRITRNTKVDLVLGSIGQNTPFAVPNLIGRTLGDAESILMGLSLVKGQLTPDSLGANAVVSKQVPAFGKNSTIRRGERVDLWLSPPKPRPVKVAKPVVDSTQQAPADTTQR